MSKALAPVEEIKQSLSRMKESFKAALPAHIPVDKFIRVLSTAVQTNPNLVNANRQSLYAAAMKAAADGLIPDGKESSIVTFKDQAQYMPMVSGILKKVRNSGELKSITSLIVYKNDPFRYWIDANGEHLEHEPMIFGDRGEAIGVYAIATTKDGGIYVEVLTREQVNAVRKVSRASNNGPWAGPFEHEMWRKTAIRRLSKRLPMSTDLEHTIESDDELFNAEPETKPETVTVSQPEAEPQPKQSRVSQAIEAAMEESETIDVTSVAGEDLPI